MKIENNSILILINLKKNYKTCTFVFALEESKNNLMEWKTKFRTNNIFRRSMVLTIVFHILL